MDITKVIIPAAGLGTRFLPYTKAIPKEMLPLINEPAIHYIVKEALGCDIHQMLMITSKGKESISNYFDSDTTLETILHEKNKAGVLSGLEKIMRLAQFCYIRQSEALGLGHAISLARSAIGKEYFGIMLPDDIIISQVPALLQLMRIARQEKASVIAVQEIPDECISSYGVVNIKKQITPNLVQINGIVEKPQLKDAPSSLAVVGRYIVSYKLFAALDTVDVSTSGEIQLTDGITRMIQQGEKVFACKLQGTRYDIGTPLGWIKTIIGLALQDPQYAPYIKDFLAGFNTIDSFRFNSSKNITHTL